MQPSFSVTDPFWLIIAFGLGFGARAIGLPPMVGYLVAGFALAGFGMQSGPLLEGLANLGITLMLFTIGLKISLKTLRYAANLGRCDSPHGDHVCVATLFVMGLGALGLGAVRRHQLADGGAGGVCPVVLLDRFCRQSAR
jgi:glutathione-regulated potassium-efflux system ancillary protein KefC